MNNISVTCKSLAIVVLFCLPALAQPYRLPPDEVVRLIDVPPPPDVDFSPNYEWMLLMGQDAMPSIDDVARPMLRLAGIRIDPAANAGFQTHFRKSIDLQRRGSSEHFTVPLPKDARVDRVSWSHDSQSFAFTLVTDQGTQLWVAAVSDPTNPRMLTDRLLTIVEGFAWMPDAKSLLCVLVPEDRGLPPDDHPVPTGPSVQETAGETSPTRTFQDLLSSARDEALFDYHVIGQLAILSLDGNQRRLGAPAIVMDAEPAPDGQHLLVTVIDRPYSYLLPLWSFPQRYEIWDVNGRLLHEIARIPLEENVPIEGVRLGPRGLTWKSSAPATLMWVEALDGGDPRREAEHRDRWMMQSAPFSEEPQEVVRVEHRAWGVSFLEDDSQFITMEYDRDRRWMRMLLHDLDTSDAAPRVLTDVSVRDRYGDPGRILQVTNKTGHSVVLQHEDCVYRAGSGATPDGMLPFLDRQHLHSLEAERLWRCKPGSFESITAVLDPQGTSRPTFITNRQSPTTPPNYRLHSLDDDTVTALTDFPDPTPQIRDIRQQLVKYQRGWRALVRNPLFAGQLSRRGPFTAVHLGLSDRIQRRADGGSGRQQPLVIHAYPRRVALGIADTRVCRSGRRDHADCR